MDLRSTGNDPATQTILEWALRADVSKALAASNVAASCAERGINQPCVQRFLSRCESPAERQFLLGFFLAAEVQLVDGVAFGELPALCFRHLELYFTIWAQAEKCDHKWDCGCAHGPAAEACDHSPPFIARVDFEIYCANTPYSVAVEIDGHEFHERSKEQSRADKSRDRRLMRADDNLCAVFRFTGSEIFADPASCASETLMFLGGRAQRFVAGTGLEAAQ